MSEVWYPGLGKEDDDRVQRVHEVSGRARNEQNPLDVAGPANMNRSACRCGRRVGM